MRVICLCLSWLTLILPLSVNSSDYRFEIVAQGLEYPWSLAFLPDGSALVTERTGRLRLIRDGVLQDAAIASVPESYVAGQGGLFEVLVDTDFSSNQRIFLSYAHGDADGNATRLVSARLVNGALQDLRVLFTASPLKDTPVHYGGRLLWLGDGTLLLTLGDGFNFRERSQSLQDHFGSIVRIGVDGSVPADNPFVDLADALPEIWSYGHRNVQGIVLDPSSGDVIAHEHGPRGGDEINLIRPGLNYGWPLASHGIDYSGALVTPFQQREGTEPPLLTWTPSIAPAGMTLYRGDLFPEWHGNLLVAALAGRTVSRVELQANGARELEQLFGELEQRIRDVRSAPDGSIWLLTDSASGSVLRVVPASR